ncbi:MAG: hypothetical protein WC895_00455 [Candidatus Shapirobacteria bacterium]|jgi:hypothetical protein
MIKELFLAIALGALLGLGITGGYMALNQKNTKENKPEITEPTVIPTITGIIQTDSNSSNKLDITSPENNLLVSVAKINIIGTTSINSQIVINTISKTVIGQSDDKGNFNIPIELNAGFNIIKISSIDSTDNQSDSQLNITYSTVKI